MEDSLEIVINGRFLSQRATGVQRVAREVTTALDRLLEDGAFPGVRARLVAQPKADRESMPLRRIAVEEARGGTGHFWEQWTLPRHVRGGRLLCLGNSAPVLSLASGRPVAVMLHDQAHLLFPGDYSPMYRVFHRLIEALILRAARPLLLVSESERAALARRHPRAAARAIVAPNGSWTGDAAPGSQIANVGRRYGLFVGRPSDRKNIDGVLAVAIGLAQERGSTFRIVGPGAEALADRIPARVRHLVTLHGSVTDAELPSLYAGAAYLLYPSFYEASGLPPSEAMRFGCPVVTSDLPVMRERCEGAALFTDPADPVAIRAQVLAILDDPVCAAELARKGRARVQALTWRRQSELIVTAMLAAESSLRPGVSGGPALAA